MSETDQQNLILTIDDEQFIVQSIKNFLEDLNFDVITALGGQEGINLFMEKSPDLVIVDLCMPEVNGFDVIKKIREISEDVPILVASGAGKVNDVVDALHLGAWDYILKPITDMTILEFAVQSSLEKSRLMIENKEYKNDLEQKVQVRTQELETVNKELIETRLQLIRKLAKAAEYRDDDTGKHVYRVSSYCYILAKALNLPEEKAHLIKICSPMHDVGKIGIPDKILQKPGPLTTEERKEMQKHTLIGTDILTPFPYDQNGHEIGKTELDSSKIDPEILQMARTITTYHHEHWDGSGYPYGLKGTEIPIEARIVTLADIYDALSNKRPYKEPFDEEKCQNIIKESSGTILDPKIVDLFFENIEQILQIKENFQD